MALLYMYHSMSWRTSSDTGGVQPHSSSAITLLILYACDDDDNNDDNNDYDDVSQSLAYP